MYRKPTYTDQYISYHSHHHPRMLIGAMQCMCERAFRICDSTSKQTEMEHLARVFKANGLPEKLIRQTLSRTSTQKDHKQQPEEEPQKSLHIPYVWCLSWEVREGLCTPWGESCLQASKHSETVTCECETEHPWREEEGSGIPGPFKDCNKVYIGKAKRTLKIRVSKHKQAVRNDNQKNGIAVHAHTTNHSIN